MIASILVICVGNVCRSPMAATLLKQAFPDRRIASAGISALVNHHADPLALKVMQELGLDLSLHRARQLNEALLYDSELSLVMDQDQKRWIEAHWSQAAGRVYRWGHWSDFDIPDPYMRDQEAFRHVLTLLQRGLADWKERL